MAKQFKMYAVPFLHERTGKPLDVEKSGALMLFYHYSTAARSFPPDEIIKARVTIERAGNRKAKPKA